MDVFQLDERPLKTMVTYTNKKGQRVTVPLVNRYALIAVDVLSFWYQHAYLLFGFTLAPLLAQMRAC